MEPISIEKDNLSDGSVIALLQEHHQEMHLYSPPESIHALDIEKMHDPSITFWSARLTSTDKALVGCGALKALSDTQGEIKSMRTAKAYLRKGIAEQILLRTLEEAKQRKYTQLYLETGTHEAFLPAIGLYKKHGFEESGPFADYVLDPYSVFLKKELNV